MDRTTSTRLLSLVEDRLSAPSIGGERAAVARRRARRGARWREMSRRGGALGRRRGSELDRLWEAASRRHRARQQARRRR